MILLLLGILASLSRSSLAIDPGNERKREAFASAQERVQVVVAVPDPGLSSSLDLRELRVELVHALAGHFGQAWMTSVEVQLITNNAQRLSFERLNYFLPLPTSNAPADQSSPPLSDKSFVVVLSREGGGVGYQVIEYDWFLGSASDVVSGTTSLRSFLTADLAAAIQTTYRPLMKIVSGVDDRFESILKGGELVHPDGRASRITPGDLYAPVNFYYSRQGELINREFIPWTYLKIAQHERARLSGQVVTAYRNILGGQRRRVETYAFRKRANFPQTDMNFVRRDESRSPLAGYLIKTVPLAAEPLNHEGDLETKILQSGHTTRDGSLTLLAQPEHPIVMVNVISGEAVLAKVPFLVGSAPQALLEVPNDLVRLGVEGELQTMETELVDLVARRAVLMARARKAGKEGDLKTLGEIEAELKDFPIARTLLREITIVRVNSVEEALRQKNRAAANKVEKLCASASELVQKHLNEKVVLDFLTEINELKKTIEPPS